RLTDTRGLVRRYDAADGIAGEEGSFLLCTFWLSHALALTGRRAPAEQAFRTAASYANDVGLLAEEVDSVTGEPVGNFPQAFSHVGLINAARPIRDTARGRPTAAETPVAAGAAMACRARTLTPAPMRRHLSRTAEGGARREP